MKLELVNITKKFDEVVIFNDFNLSVKPGEFLIISGRSGSGKSTLLNMIGFLDEKYQGEIRYNNVVNTSGRMRRSMLSNDISFIFQDFGLIDNKTVIENLTIVKSLKKLKSTDREEKIRNVLNEVGLHDVSHIPVCQLSGGEQQRVAVAKAILKESKLILADEPVASLDENNALVVMDLLAKLNRDGVTILLVTHQKEIFSYGNRIIYLADDRKRLKKEV